MFGKIWQDRLTEGLINVTRVPSNIRDSILITRVA